MASPIFKRWARFVAPAVLLLGGAFVWLYSRPSELDGWKASMRARGEKLSPRALAAPFTPETAAVMQRFADAMSGFHATTIHPSGIAPMQILEPGLARVAWQEPMLVTTDHRSATWEEFAAEVEQNEEALRGTRELLRDPPRGPAYDMLDLFAPTSSPLVAKRKAVYWLWGAELNALHRGELEGALTNLHSMLAMTRMNEEEWALVNQMVRVAMAGLTASVTWEALQAPGWDEGRLSELQRDWERVVLLPAFPRTLELERATALTVFDYARTNRQGTGSLIPGGLGGINSTGSLAQIFNRQVYLPIWQQTWSKRDELRFLKSSETILQGIRAAVTNRSYAAMRPILEKGARERAARRTAFDEFRFPLGDALWPNWEKALATLMRQETYRQMAIAAIALKRHALKHGDIPDTLAALSPELLPGPPCDYMNGQSLTYERHPDGTFALYSVGLDGLDEAGSGDDLAWPRPETDRPRPERKMHP